MAAMAMSYGRMAGESGLATICKTPSADVGVDCLQLRRIYNPYARTRYSKRRLAAINYRLARPIDKIKAVYATRGWHRTQFFHAQSNTGSKGL
jgi:hypothetical protein